MESRALALLNALLDGRISERKAVRLYTRLLVNEGLLERVPGRFGTRYLHI